MVHKLSLPHENAAIAVQRAANGGNCDAMKNAVYLCEMAWRSDSGLISSRSAIELRETVRR